MALMTVPATAVMWKLLLVLRRMEVVGKVRLVLRLRQGMLLRNGWLLHIVRHRRHRLRRLHLMVRRWQELAVCLVLLVADIGHRISIPILLLVSLLWRHLGQAIIGLPGRLRAPVVVVVHDGSVDDMDEWTTSGSQPRSAPMVDLMDQVAKYVVIWVSALSSSCCPRLVGAILNASRWTS